MSKPLSSLTSADVAHLEAGDYIEAWFESTQRSESGGSVSIEPTGTTYKLSGTLTEYTEHAGDRKGLSLNGSGMTVRQATGNPGAWLVFIVKHEVRTPGQAKRNQS